ncbi:MAG TPA: hypothetical protein VG826_28200 [Pirellulales bacterium]|nr:hypothetical protein [Pirellulales bacterium]
MLCKALIGLTSAVLLVTAAARAADDVAPVKLDLRILYAGNRESDRAKDFAAFLEEHFAKVTVAGLADFKPSDADGHDVVIFDWTSIYPRDKTGKIDNSLGSISMPQAPALPQRFSRPTVLIGAAGGQLAGSQQLKINWL